MVGLYQNLVTICVTKRIKFFYLLYFKTYQLNNLFEAEMSSGNKNYMREYCEFIKTTNFNTILILDDYI